MQRTSEVVDVAAARAGDQTAFARLIEPYRRELLVHCYRMLGSLEDAEDTVQETFLRAWRRLASFEGRASFRAWCYKIATHAALDAREAGACVAAHASPTRRPIRAIRCRRPPQSRSGWSRCPIALLSAESASPEALYERGRA